MGVLLQACLGVLQYPNRQPALMGMVFPTLQTAKRRFEYRIGKGLFYIKAVFTAHAN